MALPPLASRPDLIERLGRPLDDAAEEALADRALDDASALVRLEARADYVTADGTALTDDLPHALVVVTLTAAKRALENPEGLAGEQLAGYSWRVPAEHAAGVYLTSHERRTVRRATGRSSLGGVDLDPPRSILATAYVPTSDGGDPVPWEASS